VKTAADSWRWAGAAVATAPTDSALANLLTDLCKPLQTTRLVYEVRMECAWSARNGLS
jgi:hypothetical protein